ncbi:MAG: hypothetical protein HY263_09390 [Chloroflexi bacterium]|nr:hypothetical protein [Chloroflexota bacterium]
MAPSDGPTGSMTSAAAAAEGGAMRFWSRLGQGEQLAFAGAFVLLVIGDWLLSDLLDQGGVPFAMEVAAANVLLLIYAKSARPGMAWPIPFAMLLAGLATVIFVPTISDLLVDLRQLDKLGDAGRLIAIVVDWAAGLAVGVGAWMVWRDS